MLGTPSNSITCPSCWVSHLGIQMCSLSIRGFYKVIYNDSLQEHGKLWGMRATTIPREYSPQERNTMWFQT